MQHICAATAAIGLKVCTTDAASNLMEQSFISHLAEHGLSYGTKEEYAFRFEIFKQKEIENQEINANPENTFTVGHNQFSTWTDAEYKRLLGYRGPQQLSDDMETFTAVEAGTPVDWRAKGKVNPVKNQGQCGSCWAFSATAAIESAYAISSGKLLSLSEQQVVDCDTRSYGCSGGW